MEKLKQQNLSYCFFTDESFDQLETERRIANSVATVVVLTARCLETKEMLCALQASSFHYKDHSRIILVRTFYFFCVQRKMTIRVEMLRNNLVISFLSNWLQVSYH